MTGRQRGDWTDRPPGDWMYRVMGDAWEFSRKWCTRYAEWPTVTVLVGPELLTMLTRYADERLVMEWMVTQDAGRPGVLQFGVPGSRNKATVLSSPQLPDWSYLVLNQQTATASDEEGQG